MNWIVCTYLLYIYHFWNANYSLSSSLNMYFSSFAPNFCSNNLASKNIIEPLEILVKNVKWCDNLCKSVVCLIIIPHKVWYVFFTKKVLLGNEIVFLEVKFYISLCFPSFFACPVSHMCTCTVVVSHFTQFIYVDIL